MLYFQALNEKEVVELTLHPSQSQIENLFPLKQNLFEVRDSGKRFVDEDGKTYASDVADQEFVNITWSELRPNATGGNERVYCSQSHYGGIYLDIAQPK